MTSEEAEGFYEEDEPAEKILDAFDRPVTQPAVQVQWGIDYIRSRYGEQDPGRYEQGGLLP